MYFTSDQQQLGALRWIASVAVPAISGLTGVTIGAWLTSRRDRKQRQLAFLEKQLGAFYSPMLGLRNEIKTHSALRSRIQHEANEAWQQFCAKTQHLDVEKRQQITNERIAEFTQIIEYDNTKLNEELLPAYRKMVELFRENYWLAEEETRTYYADLLEFVEIWNRWVEKALPPEVLKRLQHGEENLIPFYEHVENMHDAIRRKLKDGTP